LALIGLSGSYDSGLVKANVRFLPDKVHDEQSASIQMADSLRPSFSAQCPEQSAQDSS
jgi:hypothetical protein